MAQTVRHLAVFTDLWHDLARHIAGHCGNKFRASVKLAVNSDEKFSSRLDERGRTLPKLPLPMTLRKLKSVKRTTS